MLLLARLTGYPYVRWGRHYEYGHHGDCHHDEPAEERHCDRVRSVAHLRQTGHENVSLVSLAHSLTAFRTSEGAGEAQEIQQTRRSGQQLTIVSARLILKLHG